MNQLKCQEDFFYHQNIHLRKQIRNIDLQYQQNCCHKNKQKTNEKKDVSFLVVGPQNSGKSSLVKTIAYALNSTKPNQPQTIQIPQALIKRYDIKKSLTYKISGLTKMKQTDYRQSITGFQVQQKSLTTIKKQQYLTSQQKLNIYIKKYSSILKLIDQKVMGCSRVKTLKSNFIELNKFITKNYQTCNLGLGNIRVVLVVISILQTVQIEELNCMRFLVSDVREKGLKTIVVLTNTDRLGYLREFERLSFIEEKISVLIKELQIQSRDDFLCIENYAGSSYSASSNNAESSNNASEKENTINTQKNELYDKIQQSSNSNLSEQIIQEPHYKSRQSIYQKQKIIKFLTKIKTINQSIMTEENENSQSLVDAPVTNIYKRHFYSRSQVPDLLNPQKLILINGEKIKISKTLFSVTNCNKRVPLYSRQNVTNCKSQVPFSGRQNKNSPTEYIQKKSPLLMQNSQKQLIKPNQSYTDVQFESDQEKSFYALKLLTTIIKQNEKIAKQEDINKKLITWFCR